MSILINLLGGKKKNNKIKGVFSTYYFALTGLFMIYFLFNSGNVVYKLYTLNNKIVEVNTETEKLSAEIRSKNEVVTKYVLAKNILDYYENLQNSKFQYKDYLDQIVSFMPSEAVLKNVDFANNGWVAITVLLPNITSVEMLESRFVGDEILINSTFDSLFVEGMSRDKFGNYILKMQFSIKKNG